MEQKRVIPARVRQAMVGGNRKALSTFGKHGANVTHAKRLRAKRKRDRIAEERALQERMGVR